MKSTYLGAVLMAGASLIALASSASAQGDNTAPAAKDESQVVVITGSRVIRNGNAMPTPVTVISTDTLKEVHPGNVAEALSDLPVFNGSRGQSTNSGTNGAAGSPASSANAINAVNLRQLGVQRALVLYDGHRAAPSTADGTVDLDTIPQMLLKRVDVVTGGVSAVYGSDAITGVVNFVTDTGFNGLKIDGQAGRSTYNDADTYQAGIAFGKRVFNDRGHLMGSYEIHHQDPLDSKFDRPWGKNVYTMQGAGTLAQPYYQVSGARDSATNASGRVNGAANVAVLGDTQFASGGYLVPFTHGTALGSQGGCKTCEVGGDGGYYNGQLRASLDMQQLYGRFDYDLSDDLHGYVTIADTYNRSIATGNYTSNSAYTIGANNAFLSPTVQGLLSAAGKTSFTMGKIWTEIPRGETESRSNNAFINAGLQGKLGEYKWDVNASQSAATFKVSQNEAIDQGKFYAALDSVVSGGTAVCRASLTNSAYAGCVPLNPFGTNSGSQAAIDYFMTTVDYQTKVGMTDLTGNITGSPFSTWAGPVDVALSTEYRKLTYEIDSHTPLPSARANCTGILYGCSATGTAVYSTQVASVPEVSQTVSEGAIEFQVPLAKDMTFAKSLQMNAAARYASYDRAGVANTWKLGLTWDVNDMLTFRATRSKDFRAPTLDENFRATSLSAPARAFYDTLATSPSTLAGQNPNAATLNGGNPDLKPEVGYTWTYGFVVKPRPNLSFSVDAFAIKVREAIFLIQGNTPIYQNACYAGGGTSESNPGSSQYCQLIVRDSTGDVVEWKQTYINLAELDTNGLDFEANYRTDLFKRPFSMRVLGTYQPHLIYKQPGIVDADYAGSSFGTNGLQANPEWRWTGFFAYRLTPNLTASLQERWRSSLPKVDGSPTAYYSGSPVKAVAYTNINLAYNLPRSNLQMYLNVQNLFNTAPPQAGFWGNPNPGQFGEFAQGDDVIGRYFTVGFHYRR